VPLDTAVGFRDRAMLEVLYATGLRRSELLHLKIVDVDFERGTIFVRQGKGKKDRILPISVDGALVPRVAVGRGRSEGIESIGTPPSSNRPA
jgi:site-specific recombinase XerD